MGKKKSHSDWLLERVKLLSDYGDKFAKTGPTIEYGPHTLLKLICVSYYAEMFSKVATGDKALKQGYDGAIYLDLFAGPGIVKIRGSGDTVAGSPIAAISAAMAHGTPFDHSILVESDPKRSSALQDRLSTFLSSRKFTVINGDCNSEVTRMMDLIEEKWPKPIILSFVDPEGMETKWETMKHLSETFPSLDFMINLTSGISRVAGRLASGMEGDRPIFEDFFGKDAESVLVNAAEGHPINEQYERGIKRVLGKPMGATIPIKDESNRLVYQILAYTRLSWTGSPWAIGFEYLKKRLTGINGAHAMTALNVARGRQPIL